MRVVSFEIADLDAAKLTTRVDGRLMQQAPFDDLIDSIPAIVSYISKFTPLYRGDVVATEPTV